MSSAGSRTLNELCDFIKHEVVVTNTINPYDIIPELEDALNLFGYLVFACEKCGKTYITKDSFTVADETCKRNGWTFENDGDYDTLCDACSSSSCSKQ